MIRYVTVEDTAQILNMMELVKDDFAGYMEKEFVEALNKAIEQGEAILEEERGRIGGMLIFSRGEKELSFLAVHPEFRKKGIAKRLIDRMIDHFQAGDILYVVTFQEGDPKGKAARGCYHACGFVDDEKFMVYDYPCQKMILEIRDQS